MKTPRHLTPSDFDAATAVAGQLMETLRREQPWALQSRTAAHWKLRQRIAQESAERRRPRLVRRAFSVSLLATATAACLFALLRPQTLPSQDPAGAGSQPSDAVPGSRVADALVENWSQFTVADLGTLELSAEEGFEIRELPTERQLRIGQGTLRAQIAHQDPLRPVVVVTPRLRVVVIGTRFDVTTSGGLSRVDVLEGRVRVESPGGSVVLTGGMTVRSDDPRLRSSSQAPAGASPAPSELGAPAGGAAQPTASPMRRARRQPAPVEIVDCERLEPGAAQRRCFEQLASGDDLAAQNALFALAVRARDVDRAPERAADLFRTYLQRFPSGPLAPEAALGQLEVYESLGRADDAIASAAEFERQFAADARAPEVALVRAQLECRDPKRREQALSMLDRLAARPQPSLRDAALRARAECAAGSDVPRTADPSPPRASGPPAD